MLFIFYIVINTIITATVFPCTLLLLLLMLRCDGWLAVTFASNDQDMALVHLLRRLSALCMKVDELNRLWLMRLLCLRLLLLLKLRMVRLLLQLLLLLLLYRRAPLVFLQDI